MEEAENTGAVETAEKDPGADEPQDAIEEAYSRDPNPKLISQNNGAKSRITTRSGLEKTVSELQANRKENDDPKNLKAKLLQNSAINVDVGYRNSSEEDEDTLNGAVAIIYHQDKKGNLEFLFEEKPVDYPVPEARGKLSFVGGVIQIRESSLEALVRELTEEIEEPVATILLKALSKNVNTYRRLPYEYKGRAGYTDIYVIQVEQETDWNAVKWAAFKHDAGFPRVLTHNDVIERSKDFAFGYGEIAREFVKNNLKSNELKFTPFVYADSINKACTQVVFSLKNYSLNL